MRGKVIQHFKKTNLGRRTAVFTMPLALGLCSAALLFPAPAPFTQQAAGPGASFVGSQACATCHEDQARWMKGSVHYPTMEMDAKAPEKGNGCESCHGPGGTHASDPSKNNILIFKTEAALRRSNACLSCHGKKAGLMDFKRTDHRFQKISCDQCHANGDSKAFHSMRDAGDVKRATSSNLCLECHSDTRASWSMPFHHRVLEGLMTCQDCHKEHGGFRAGRRRAAEFDERCVKCHSDKGGPFVFEHIPMRVGGCVSCHAPHGSTNPRMLTRSEMLTLCLECHTNTPRSHDLSQPRYQNCTICHKAIHGSNHDRVLIE